MLNALPSLSLPECVATIQTLACIGLVLDAAETLYTRHEYRRGGIYDWDLVCAFFPWIASARLSPLLTALLRYPNYLVVVALQLLAALLLLTQRFPALALALVLIILTSRILFLFRHQYGGEGADQMQVIVFTGLAAYYAAPDALGQHAALWFIGLQAIVAYVAAGRTKLQSPAWREGRAMAAAMRTSVFGNQVASRVLDRIPRLSWTLCWSAILFECVCPLLVVFGPVPCLVFLTCGVLFHLSNALLMGLNKFLWGFSATYPAILLISSDLNLPDVARRLATSGSSTAEWPEWLAPATWVCFSIGVGAYGARLIHRRRAGALAHPSR